MSSLSPQTMVVGCPHCGTQLQVPKEMGGRQGQCLRCQGVVDIPYASSLSRPLSSLAKASPPQYVAAEMAEEPDEYSLAAPTPTMPALDVSNYVPKSGPAQASQPSGGFFAAEKSGLDAGILGGIGLMFLSVVWFFGALFLLDVIFIYPPILFIIGLIACVRGLINTASGN